MKTCKSILSVLLALMLCLGSFAFAEEAVTVYQLGDKIEDFTITTWDNQTVTLSEVLKEKKMVLINIWATWCGPCRSEFPFMEAAYEQYQDQIEIIALSVEETDTPDVLESFVSELGMTFKVGRDTPDFRAKFNATGIPTSVLVDRNGVICFIETGSVPDMASFTRLFDLFTADDYTDPVLLDGIPMPKPNVAASAEADVAAALEVETAANPVGEYDWPMIVAEKDGRTVVQSSNTGIEDTTALVDTTFTAKAGDAIVVTFKISSASACDVMQLRVNDQLVKSLGGEKDWMTYAYQLEADGDYKVSVAYVNQIMACAGEDTLWVDSIALLSGDEAADALDANPVFPVSDEIAITVLNETAKHIVFDDPTGLIGMYYGDAEFYIIPDEVAQFGLDMTAGYDPEMAMVSFNYDGATYSLAETEILNGQYTACSLGDCLEETGYSDSSVFLYPTMEDYELGKTVTYFKNEENVNAFVTELSCDENGTVLGSWTYADGTAPSTSALPIETEQEDGMSDYVLTCVDQDENPVPGVMLQVCDDATCQVFVSDENGQYVFTSPAYAWEVHILKAPEGYTADSTDVVVTPVEGGELVFTLTRD